MFQKSSINGNHMENDNLAILCISLDLYSDCWETFFLSFFKHYPNCKYKIYLGSNEKDFEFPNVTVLKTGKYINWSDNVNIMLNQIDEKYIFVLQEEVFLNSDLTNEMLAAKMELVSQYGMDFLRVLPRPRGSKKVKGEKNLYKIMPSDPYCVTAGFVIWKKICFQSVLQNGQNPWQFEVNNTIVCNEMNRLPGEFYTVKKPLFQWVHGIDGGKWTRSAAKFIKKNNYPINIKIRGVCSRRRTLFTALKNAVSKLFPRWLIRFMKKTLKFFGLKKAYRAPF